MTNSYARDSYAYGFDFTRTRTREERVARLDVLANLLDTAFILPGTNVRFGFDALIGLVPGIGDAITTAISLYIVHEARQLGAPAHLILRMLANVAVDGFVGAVPLVGDAFARKNRLDGGLLRRFFTVADCGQEHVFNADRRAGDHRLASPLSAHRSRAGCCRRQAPSARSRSPSRR